MTCLTKIKFYFYSNIEKKKAFVFFICSVNFYSFSGRSGKKMILLEESLCLNVGVFLMLCCVCSFFQVFNSILMYRIIALKMRKKN